MAQIISWEFNTGFNMKHPIDSAKENMHISANYLKKLLTLLSGCFMVAFANAQIENVIVETYYISDVNDATDTIGGGIEAGTKTYRVYLDLAEGAKLKKIYGDQYHPLIFISSADFFNNKEDGQTIGKEFSVSRLQENTVALDTWITLGQTSRVAVRTNFGVLKINDDNGSLIGGINNDGGSATITEGLLINEDAAAGIPLTEEDGMDTMTVIPGSWADYGFANIITGEDSTIFGSVISGNHFESRNAGLLNSGVTGVNPSTNQVIVAQLTTTGDLTFELNIEVEIITGTGIRTIKYVARDSFLTQGEQLSPFLKYPQLCGCQDPDFIEYSPAYACGNSDSCRTAIAFGCTDPLACNYDPSANFNVQEICCYIGDCNDLDISLVCPSLTIEKNVSLTAMQLYPNPANSLITLEYPTNVSGDFSLKVFDQSGRLIHHEPAVKAVPEKLHSIEISSFTSGMYYVQLIAKELLASVIFIKE